MERLGAWLEAERGRFFLLLPIAMGAAILVYFDLPAEPPLWLSFLLLICASAALAAAWRFPLARFFAALALAAALGFARAEWRTAMEPPLISIPYGVITVSGTLVSIDDLPNGRRATITEASLNTVPTPRAIRVKLRAADTTPLTAGEKVSIKSMLFKPDRPAYPGGWDSGRDAFFQGLGAAGFATGDVAIIAPANPGTVLLRLRRLREVIAANIMAVLPVQTGAIAVTLFTGMEQDIPVQERQNFIAAGLAHILAVAGLHVGIVMGLFFSVARWALTRHESTALRLPAKPIAAAIALLAGAAYAALTGAHLPILRSLAMASLVTLGVIAGRRAISLRGLALAAMLIMLATPEAVIGTSFQMSFSAVAALISGYAAARGWFARLHEGISPFTRTAAHFAGLFYTSLLAGAASMPFAAYQFQQVQPYWILANLVAVPLTALWIMPLGLLSLVLMPMGCAALTLVPMGWGISIIVRTTNVISAWPEAMLRVTPMPSLAILLYAAGLAWLCIWRSRVRLAGLTAMAAALTIYFTARPPDILVSPDAKLIAVSAPPELFLLRQKKASGFTLAQWQSVWGGKDFSPFDTALCGTNTCVIKTKFGQIAIALAPPESCPHASLIISPEPLHGACQGTPFIDRFSVWHDGAVAAWLTPTDILFRTDREIQGARPWVLPWPDWGWSKASENVFGIHTQ
jgi:competence protein ComEC